MVLAEWTVGPYEREVELPRPVNGDLVNATYDNGVFVLSMPKATQGQRTVPAEFGLETVGDTRRARGPRGPGENTLSREDSDKVYERYHIPAPGSFVWAGPLANFTPGHQDVYVNFRNEDRAPLLFIAGGEDNLMPPAVNQSNAKHYRHTNSVTDYKEFPGRSHYTVGQDGWEEVADYALEWAVEHAKRPAA